MKHPNQATLALHAGGDLGFWTRWKTARHVLNCEQCRRVVAEYESLREILPELNEIPEIPWNRMAAEMKANIRLGLEAGECVRAGDAPLRNTPWFTGARAAIAMASIMALMVTGIVLEHPAPVPPDDGSVVQATANGIQVRKGRQSLGLMNAGADLSASEKPRVTYSPDARGGMRARYVDPETGYVTINNVYVE